MKNRIITYTTIFAVACTLLLMGCSKRDLNSDSQQGLLQIDLNWQSQTPPVVTEFIFFREGTADPMRLPGTSDGFYGMMPSGNYQVLMYNPDMERAHIDQTNQYNTATFSADADTRAAGYVSSVKDVFGVYLASVVVPGRNQTVTYTAIPIKYEKDIEVNADPDGIPNIASIELEISGIIRSVYVYDRSIADLNTYNIMIPTTLDVGSSMYKGDFSVFDIYGTCEIRGVVRLTDNDVLYSYPEDITSQVQNIPSTGTTINTTLNFPTGGGSIDLQVEVKPWQSGAPGGGIVG